MAAAKQQPAQAPTPEEMAKMQSVAQAGATAAADAGSAEQATEQARAAMREEADRVNLEITDEQISMIATAAAQQTIVQLEERGAFTPPPDPVQPPPQAAAPPPATEGPEPSAAPAPESPPATPQKQTFAHRFFGAS